jgi:hypothetical protein
MPNRIEAAKRKLSHKPPGDYCHCASSRLHKWLHPIWPALARTFRVAMIEGSNYLSCDRLARPGLDLYHSEAARGTPNHVPVAATCSSSVAVGRVK